MILPIHQWHDVNNGLTRLRVDNADLTKQNKILQDKLSKQIYLSRDEVERIIDTTIMAYQCGVEEINEIAFEDAKADENGTKSITIDAEFHKQIDENKKSTIDYAITAICNLAIPEVKYLDRKKLEEIFFDIVPDKVGEYDIAIDKILTLAIDKDSIRKRIVEVLERWINFNNLESIANEILTNKPIDCYSKTGEIINDKPIEEKE